MTGGNLPPRPLTRHFVHVKEITRNGLFCIFGKRKSYFLMQNRRRVTFSNFNVLLTKQTTKRNNPSRYSGTVNSLEVHDAWPVCRRHDKGGDDRQTDCTSRGPRGPHDTLPLSRHTDKDVLSVRWCCPVLPFCISCCNWCCDVIGTIRQTAVNFHPIAEGSSLSNPSSPN